MGRTLICGVLASDCLTCPLPECDYAAGRLSRNDRDVMVAQLRNLGRSNTDIAVMLGVGVRSVERALRKERVPHAGSD